MSTNVRECGNERTYDYFGTSLKKTKIYKHQLPDADPVYSYLSPYLKGITLSFLIHAGSL